MRFRSVVALATTLLLVTACGPGSGTGTPAATPSSDASASAASVEPAKTSGIWFEPAGLRACARPDKVMVHWDARSVQGAKIVDIFAIGKTGQEALFLTAGGAGSRESGAWMRAGSQMVLRNKADGSEISRATVESIPCD